MKKVMLGFLLAGGLYACGGGTNDAAKPADAATAANDISKHPDYAPGLELIAKSDCTTCHKVAEASTGPSFNDIAAKYASTPEMVDTLAHKVIKGGSGNWGAVPMTPHPALTVEDASKMVKYILLHKKQG